MNFVIFSNVFWFVTFIIRYYYRSQISSSFSWCDSLCECCLCKIPYSSDVGGWNNKQIYKWLTAASPLFPVKRCGCHHTQCVYIYWLYITYNTAHFDSRSNELELLSPLLQPWKLGLSSYTYNSFRSSIIMGVWQYSLYVRWRSCVPGFLSQSGRIQVFHSLAESDQILIKLMTKKM